MIAKTEEFFHMKRILIRMAAVLTLVTCISLLACAQKDQEAASPPEKVTIACATPPYTALVDIALSKGYFRQKGLEVTPRFHSTGKAALDEVIGGKADFATAAETPVMFAVMNGSKISVIATIQRSNKTSAILGRGDKGIRTPKDLKGRRIAASLGTIGEYFLDAFLATHGMARKDVEVVNLKPEEMPEALAKGEIEAASTFSPFLNQGQQMLGDKAITLHEEDIFTQSFNLVATQEQVRSNPAKVRKMLLALIEAEQFALRNPAEAQKAIADFRKMDRTVLGEMWASHTFGVSLDQSLILALEGESQWAISNGLTGATKVPNYLDFVYLEGLGAVKPKAVRMVR